MQIKKRGYIDFFLRACAGAPCIVRVRVYLLWKGRVRVGKMKVKSGCKNRAKTPRYSGKILEKTRFFHNFSERQKKMKNSKKTCKTQCKTD